MSTLQQAPRAWFRGHDGRSRESKQEGAQPPEAQAGDGHRVIPAAFSRAGYVSWPSSDSGNRETDPTTGVCLKTDFGKGCGSRQGNQQGRFAHSVCTMYPNHRRRG